MRHGSCSVLEIWPWHLKSRRKARSMLRDPKKDKKHGRRL